MIRLKKDLTGLDCKVTERAIEYNGSISINSKKEISKMFRFLFAGVLAISALLFQSCGGGIDENAPLFAHQKDGKWGYVTADSPQKLIDGKFKVVIKHQFDAAESFREDGLARVQLNGKYGVINRAGKAVVPIQYDRIVHDFTLKEGLVPVQLFREQGGPKTEYIDISSGKSIIPDKYEDVGGFSEGFVAVSLNGKWGFIDRTGKELVPPKYDGAHHFSEGLAAVLLDGKWGYIDRTGKEVIPIKYDAAGLFRNGKANVSVNHPGLVPGLPRRENFTIDKEGNIVER